MSVSSFYFPAFLKQTASVSLKDPLTLAAQSKFSCTAEKLCNLNRKVTIVLTRNCLSVDLTFLWFYTQKSFDWGQEGVLGLWAAVLTSFYLCCCFAETCVLYVCIKGLRSDCVLN